LDCNKSLCFARSASIFAFCWRDAACGGEWTDMACCCGASVKVVLFWWVRAAGSTSALETELDDDELLLPQPFILFWTALEAAVDRAARLGVAAGAQLDEDDRRRAGERERRELERRSAATLA